VTENIPISVGGTFFYAFSELVWLYSIQAEVFALNNLLVALLLFLLLKFESTHSAEKFAYVYFGAAICGFGASHQHTISLFVIPIIAWSFLHQPQLLRPHHLVKLAIAFLIGLLPLLHLLFSANGQKLYSWGNTSTLDGFLTHFLRKEYG
jgi:hypothetical protein